MKRLFFTFLTILLVLSFSACGGDEAVVVKDGFAIIADTPYTAALNYGAVNIVDVGGDPLGAIKLKYNNTVVGESTDVSVAAGGDGSKSLRIQVNGTFNDTSGVMIKIGCKAEDAGKTDWNYIADYLEEMWPRPQVDITSYITNASMIKFAIKALSGDLNDVKFKVGWGHAYTNFTYMSPPNWAGYLHDFREFNPMNFVVAGPFDGWYAIEIPFNGTVIQDTNTWSGGDDPQPNPRPLDPTRFAEIGFLKNYTFAVSFDILVDNLRIEE